MGSFSYELQFTDVGPDQRTWLYVCSKSGEEQRTKRTWTDDAGMRLNLRDMNDSIPTEHALIAFRRGHPPRWFPLDPPTPPGTPGTPPPDSAVQPPIQLPFAFDPEVQLKLRIWIVAGDFNRQRLRVINSVLLANILLNEEATGIVLKPVEIVDATKEAAGNPLAAGLSWGDFDTVATHARVLENAMGRDGLFDSCTLNVFYVDTITNQKNGIHGTNCHANGQFAVAIDRCGLDDLLLHEIGHTMWLGDIRIAITPPRAPRTGLYSQFNVMNQFAFRRYFFTEGQIIGMHFDPESVLNVGRVPDRRDTWFASSKPVDLLKGRPSLAEDHLAFLRTPMPLPLRSVTCSEAKLEDYVAASRERYFLRSCRLDQLQGDGDGDGVVGGTDLALLRMSIEDYVAADIARLYERLLVPKQSGADQIAVAAEAFRNDLIATIQAIPGIPADLPARVHQYIDHLMSNVRNALG